MNQYKPGDRVKIISLEKVRSYPVASDGWRNIGGPAWVNGMDEFAGTTQEIRRELDNWGYYKLKNDQGDYSFSTEMIEGPADPVEQEGQEELWKEAILQASNWKGEILIRKLSENYTITRKK